MCFCSFQVLSYVSYLTQAWYVGYGARIAALTFTGQVTDQFLLNAYTNEAALQQRIMNMAFTNTTGTDLGGYAVAVFHLNRKATRQ